jgi:hypothetical protein
LKPIHFVSTVEWIKSLDETTTSSPCDIERKPFLSEKKAGLLLHSSFDFPE